jgi:hypothetical protein
VRCKILINLKIFSVDQEKITFTKAKNGLRLFICLNHFLPLSHTPEQTIVKEHLIGLTCWSKWAAQGPSYNCMPKLKTIGQTIVLNLNLIPECLLFSHTLLLYSSYSMSLYLPRISSNYMKIDDHALLVNMCVFH